MQLLLPPPPSSVSGVIQSLGGLWNVLTNAFTSIVSANEAAPRVILRSPTGLNYAITVDDAGVLHTAVATKQGF